MGKNYIDHVKIDAYVKLMFSNVRFINIGSSV